MRNEKQLLLDEVKDKANSSRIVMLLRYANLSANATADFRTGLVKAGGEMTVIGKRVFRKAAEEVGFVLKDVDMSGHIAFVTSDEHPVATTKAVFAFRKDNKDTIEIIGGQFAGQACSAEEFEQVAKLPTREEMYAQLLGVFNAPMTQMVSVMQSLLSSPMHLLENKVQKESAS